MKRAGLLLAFALLTAIAAVSASRLRIQAEPVDLLPENSPAAQDYRLFLDKFGGIEDLYVLLRSPSGSEIDAESLIDAAERLASELEALPQISRVQSGVDPEDEAFLLERVLPVAPLLLDGPDDPSILERLQPDAIRERVRNVRRELSGPAGGATAAIRAADPLGFGERLLAERGGGFPIDPLSGAFYSETHGAALLIAAPAAAALDASAGRAILAALQQARERLSAGDPPIELLAVGGPLYAAQDEAAMRRDLIGTVLSSLVAIGLILLAYFRGFGLPLALTSAVGTGVLLTGGAVAAIQPEISVLGVAFASILIGLGIDYGIHGATRFRQRLDAGEPADRAMHEAIADCRGGILSSVATTAAVFAVLVLASFPPLRQLGWVVALGILIVLLTTRAVGVSVALLLASPSRPTAAKGRQPLLSRALQRWVDAGAAMGTTRPAGRLAVLGTAALLLVGAVLGLGRLEFDANLRALRSADHPALQAEQALLSTFDLGLESTSFVVSGETPQLALEQAATLAADLRGHDGRDGRVASPTDWIPARRTLERRLQALPQAEFAAAATALERALHEEGLRPEAFSSGLDVLRAIGRGELPPTPHWQDAPRWIRDAVHRETDKTYVHLRVNAAIGAGFELGSEADLVRSGVAVASVPRLGSELQQKIGDDFRRLDFWALAVVLLVVAVSFRGKPLPALLALVPVIFGCVVTLGLFGWLGAPLDPFTILVAPILLGIGVDDGLHALHGAERHGSVAASIRHAGQAITLTTLTTGIGFGSLWFSSVPALQRGGLAVAVGVGICWLATVVLLPALDHVSAK